MGKIIIGSIIWLCVIPFALGLLPLSFTDRKEKRITECMVLGYLVMFALCQIIAVPLILLKIQFHVFCRALAATYVILAAGGLMAGRAWWPAMTASCFRNLLHHSWTVYAAIAAVLVQAYYYIQYMVTNLDDAYFVAVATTAIETDTMYLYSPYTGRAVDVFNLRYCLSPFSMLQAFLSRCIGVHPSTLDHTIMAPALVMIAYMVYAAMGHLLFAPETMVKMEEKDTEKMTGLFILFLSMIHVTSYYCIRNQGSVLLVRLWQGKAVLAAVLIPFLFYHCYRMYRKPQEKGNLLILLMAVFACCLVSSMGIALPVVMLGIFALLFGAGKKRGRYMMNMIVGALPCVVYGLMYIVMKAMK